MTTCLWLLLNSGPNAEERRESEPLILGLEL